MILCHCHGITDRDLQRAAQSQGSAQGTSPAAIAGTGCGGCRAAIREVLQAATTARGSEGGPVGTKRR